MQTPFHHIHRHIRQHHKKYLLGTAIGGLGFFMIKILVSLIGIFGVLQHPGTFASGGPACGGRDNSQFLTGSFRESTPDNDKIICALLGDGNVGANRTAYTSTRNTVSCDIANMVVTGVVPGTDTLPASLEANTIYVLESGTYTTTDTRNMGTCSAIIGKGLVEIKGNFTTNARLLQSAGKNNWIVDNLSLNRNRGTNTGTTTDVVGIAGSSSLTVNTIKVYSGYRGMNIYSAANYVTVNNSESYDNSSNGIYLYNSMNYGKINNCRVYNNNDYGILLSANANSGQINNSQVYNNSGGGIRIANSLYGQVNNSTAYNNTGQGIYFYNNANYGQINNSQSYNNTSIGIYGYNVTNLIINTAQSYNNASYGIDIYNTQATPPPNYSKINNSQSYNNAGYGIVMRNVPYTQINNSQSYNNSNYGMLIYKSNNNQIHNSQSYNNITYGIAIQRSNYVTINNTHIYNNSTYGLLFSQNASYGLVYNSQIYNNGASGIVFSSGSNNILSNSSIYNNISYGININAASIGNIYYGINNIFGNTTDAIGGTIENLTPGRMDGWNEVMERSNGTIAQISSMSRDYITNPKNLSGEYLFSRTGTMSDIRGRKKVFAFDAGMQYSYGSGTLTQVQPVLYDGTTLVASGIYDANNYIGGNFLKSIGEFFGSRGTYLGSTMMVTATTQGYTKYNLYGDIISPVFGIDSNTSTGITLSGATATKTIIAQFYTPNTTDSTHFQKNTTDIGQVQILYTYPSSGTTIATLTGYTGLSVINNNGSNVYMRTGIDISGTDLSFTFIVQDMYGNTGSIPVRLWNNDIYITDNFWNASPTVDNIISALLGDGSGGVDKTIYTSGRNTNTCNIANMVVTGVVPGTNTLPVTLAANTIYVLESGTYITTATRNMANCSAIIGKGTVEIKANFTTNTRLINSASKTNRILDNLNLNRNRGNISTTSMDVVYTLTSPSISFNAIQAYSGYVGIYANGSSYTNISNTQAYTNLAQGIVIQNSLYSSINNTKSYNNTSIGIYFYIGANYGIINNSQSYNNGSVGVYFNTSHSGIINNVQSYNNTNYGIHILTSNNTQINNSQSYNNNSHGIYTLTSNNIQMNNSQSYNNNGVGMFLATSNYSSINNSQIYNNSFGVQYSTASNSGIINNSQIYNQTNQGIYYNSGSNNIVHDSAIYNIGSPAVYSLVGCTNNKYYGTIYMFGNSSNIGGTAPQTFFSGTDGLLGRSDGTIQTPILSRDYITNPVNLSGDYFFLRTGTMASLRGRKITSVLIFGMQYSYGSGTLTQVQPIIYSGTTLITSGTYDANNYIGGSIVKTTGDVLGINQYNGVNSIVTGIGNLPISTYTIYGNIQNILGGIPINTSTTIQLTTGSATNKLIVQLYNPINYFATHFQKITTIDQTPPSVPTLLSPTSGTQISTGALILVRSDAIDTGAGIGGYSYQVSRNIGFTDIVISGNKATTGVSLESFLDGTYYRRVAAYDEAGNTGTRSSINNFTIATAVMIDPPIVGTGYIFAGTTGNNNGNIYYVGTVTSRAYLSGIDITSCEYSTGGGRSAATIGSDYCEIANQDFGSDIVLSFRATNTGGTTTGASTSYIYDAIPPSGGSFTINANATYTTGTNVFLTTTCATDTGINGLQVSFGSSASPTNRQSCSSSIARTLPTGDGTKTIYMRFKDEFGNITTDTTDSILLDASGPAAPVVISPINGVVLSTGNISLLRSGSLDAGIGTSGYVWQVSTGNTFVTLLTGGTTSSTGVNLIGLSATTYYRRVYTVDQLYNTGTRSATGYFSISSAINFDIAAPTTLNIGSISVPENTQVIEKVFTGTATYFTLADYVGDDQGYYTTLSMTNLTDGQGHIVSNANVAIKTATNIVTISGSPNSNVVTSITGSYMQFGNNVLTFIKRDAGSNGGIKGTYGVAPALQITVPQLQTPGNYSGTLIYTFYPN